MRATLQQADTQLSGLHRNRAAFALAYQARITRPINITCLTLSDRIKLLHLPAESFIEYQLQAQLAAHYHTVLTAAYGDCGRSTLAWPAPTPKGATSPKILKSAPRLSPLWNKPSSLASPPIGHGSKTQKSKRPKKLTAYSTACVPTLNTIDMETGVRRYHLKQGFVAQRKHHGSGRLA